MLKKILGTMCAISILIAQILLFLYHVVTAFLIGQLYGGFIGVIGFVMPVISELYMLYYVIANYGFTIYPVALIGIFILWGVGLLLGKLSEEKETVA